MHADISWLILDKKDSKIRFLSMSGKFMPNAARLVPLMAYIIDRKYFITEDGQKFRDPCWAHVNWEKVEERVMEAIAQPRSSDEKLRSMPVHNWHLEHLSKFKSRQKTFSDFCEFFKNQ